MSRPLLILSVVFASYAILSTLASLAVALAWRLGLVDAPPLSPAARGRRIVLFRAVPAAGSALITFGLVTPGFVIFEPSRGSETVGPLLLFASAGGVLVIAAAIAVAIRTMLATITLERAWLRSAAPFDCDPPAGVPAFAIDSFAPIVALVGVFSPKLLAARTVIEACSREELAGIVAHERGHLQAKDNVKRWMMACAPDPLRWTPVHGAMLAAWCDAAEDAADDAATAGEEAARVALAALLLKVARLTPQAPWTAATVSTFVDADGLDRRVRRLLQNHPARASSPWIAGLPVAAAGLVLAVGAGLNSPATLERVYELVEALVALGR